MPHSRGFAIIWSLEAFPVHRNGRIEFSVDPRGHSSSSARRSFQERTMPASQTLLLFVFCFFNAFVGAAEVRESILCSFPSVIDSHEPQKPKNKMFLLVLLPPTEGCRAQCGDSQLRWIPSRSDCDADNSHLAARVLHEPCEGSDATNDGTQLRLLNTGRVHPPPGVVGCRLHLGHE